MRKWKRWVLIPAIILLSLCALGAATVFGVNVHVKSSVSDRILSSEDAAKLTDVDCILVLGCHVRENGVPSDMLNVLPRLLK